MELSGGKLRIAGTEVSACDELGENRSLQLDWPRDEYRAVELEDAWVGVSLRFEDVPQLDDSRV